jgi:hypothetical protein
MLVLVGRAKTENIVDSHISEKNEHYACVMRKTYIFCVVVVAKRKKAKESK